MRNGRIWTGVITSAFALLLCAPLVAQNGGKPAPAWAPPKTPWGHPNIEGIYTNKDENNTPFERPAEFAGKRLADFGESEMALLRRQRQEAAAADASKIGGTAEEDTGGI